VPGPLPPLSGRVGVTGAGGFVGGWLVRHLRQVGGGALEVVPLLDRASADIRDAAAVAEAVRGVRPRAVVHLAAVAAPAEAHRAPREAWDVNLIGTLNLAQAILAHAPEALLVHVGSAEVYGDSFADATAPLAEEAALRPRSVYGATKAAADIMIAQMAREGLRAVRFRPFNHTGPGQSAEYVASAFARQIARIERGLQEPVLSVGNLEVERDFLDVRDVVAAYAAALARPDAVAGQALNLATGQPVRVERLLGMLLELSGLEVEVRTDPARIRPDEVPTISGDAGRARALLGWRPSIPLDRTLADVLEHWKDRTAPA
jgi:GDP-4-dehydro-6-deoxy-D-mannose reductase